TPAAVTASFGRPLLAVRARERYQALLALRGFEHVHTVFPFGETLHYSDERSGLDARAIAGDLRAFLAQHNIDAAVEPVAPTIEDTFMERLA
ncbi:MAG TPA: ABC transporter ATP-binding protein, partial [Thermoanaerobaculia bacterium]|nr:ABC transporter ATP-binding protein [Thermoanaerobaculia bacterium]